MCVVLVILSFHERSTALDLKSCGHVVCMNALSVVALPVLFQAPLFRSMVKSIVPGYVFRSQSVCRTHRLCSRRAACMRVHGSHVIIQWWCNMFPGSAEHIQIMNSFRAPAQPCRHELDLSSPGLPSKKTWASNFC